jgi:hypothetical protein
MKSFIKLGQGNLRTYFTFVFFMSFFALLSLPSAKAQVDVNIIVFEIASPSGGGIVSVNPNPVSSLAQVEHKTGVSISTLTITSAEDGVLATLHLGETRNFNISLPAGLTSWIFQTSEGLISKQVLIVEV